MSNVDLVVLGGGSGGYAAALRSAQLGLSVVLIEADKLGGTCLHRGCIPTKALLHAGEVADTTRESSQFGINSTLNSIDMNGVNSYKDGVITKLHKGLQGLVKSRGITYVEGYGKLVSKDTVEVNGVRVAISPCGVEIVPARARDFSGACEISKVNPLPDGNALILI